MKQINKLQTRDLYFRRHFFVDLCGGCLCCWRPSSNDANHLSLYANGCRLVYRDSVHALCGEDPEARGNHNSGDHCGDSSINYRNVLDDVCFLYCVGYNR